jgi:hypothetical protein
LIRKFHAVDAIAAIDTLRVGLLGRTLRLQALALSLCLHAFVFTLGFEASIVRQRGSLRLLRARVVGALRLRTFELQLLLSDALRIRALDRGLDVRSRC